MLFDSPDHFDIHHYLNILDSFDSLDIINIF